MALGNVIQELVVRIRYVVDNGGLDRANSAVTRLRNLIGGISVGYGLMRVGKMALQTAAQLESAQAQFETMLGSKAAADKMMNEMWEYAAISTFEMSDVTKAATTMLNYGLSQDKTTEYMKRLGDIAGDSAPRFERMALAFAQMFGKGRLTGEELRQFVNAGANPLRTVADLHFGGDMGKAEDAMRKRKISAEMVMEAIRKLTDEGGKFYMNQIRQSKTLMGVYTTMMDRFKMMLSQAVMAFSTPIKEVMRFLGSINIKPVVEGIQWLSYAIQYLTMVVWNSGLREAWAGFVEMIQVAGIALVDAGGATGGLGNMLQTTGKILAWVLVILMKTTTFLTRVFLMALSTALPILREFGGALMGAFWIVQKFLESLKYVGWALLFLISLFVQIGLIIGVVSGFMSASVGAVSALAGGFAGLTGALGGFLGLLPAAITGMAALLGPVWATVAAILAMGWALWRLDNALNETVRREAKEREDAARGKVEDILNQRSREYDEAKKTGDKKQIALAKKRWEAMRDAYRKTYLGKPLADENIGDMSFEAFVRREQEGASAATKKIVSSSGKTTNINQKVDFKVDVKGDKNTKSGLTAADVAMLAERASRATFSLELERVLETVI